LPQQQEKPDSLNINKSGRKKIIHDKWAGYFFVESTIFLAESAIVFVLSTIFLAESAAEVIVLSAFTVVESVVVVDELDPQAAKAVTAKTVNNFFILMSLVLYTGFPKR
jgi:hypothetical protein